MDAKSVWIGFDYAHTFDISRGVEYYPNANRVTAIAVYDKKLPGNNRATTFVKVQFRDPETGEPIEKRAPYWWEYGSGVVDEIRARELFMRWDEYEDETAHRNAEREKREAAARIERAERERIYREREEAARIEREERLARERAEREERQRVENQRRQRILTGLTTRGIAVGNVVIEDGTVAIPREVVERWLGLAV